MTMRPRNGLLGGHVPAPKGGIAALTLLAWLTGTPAAAQYGPSVACEVSDFSLALRLYMPLSFDGTGSPGQQGMQGTMEVHHQKIPKEQRAWLLDGRRPVQFWNDGRQLRMLLLFGTGPDQFKLTIDTARSLHGGEHVGEFRFDGGGVKLTGRLACSVG